jgi:hypothetical protein
MVSYFKWEIVSGKVHNKIELIKFVSAAHRLVGVSRIEQVCSFHHMFSGMCHRLHETKFIG